MTLLLCTFDISSPKTKKSANTLFGAYAGVPAHLKPINLREPWLIVCPKQPPHATGRLVTALVLYIYKVRFTWLKRTRLRSRLLYRGKAYQPGSCGKTRGVFSHQRFTTLTIGDPDVAAHICGPTRCGEGWSGHVKGIVCSREGSGLDFVCAQTNSYRGLGF